MARSGPVLDLSSPSKSTLHRSYRKVEEFAAGDVHPDTRYGGVDGKPPVTRREENQRCVVASHRLTNVYVDHGLLTYSQVEFLLSQV